MAGCFDSVGWGSCLEVLEVRKRSLRSTLTRIACLLLALSQLLLAGTLLGPMEATAFPRVSIGFHFPPKEDGEATENMIVTKNATVVDLNTVSPVAYEYSGT